MSAEISSRIAGLAKEIEQKEKDRDQLTIRLGNLGIHTLDEALETIGRIDPDTGEGAYEMAQKIKQLNSEIESKKQTLIFLELDLIVKANETVSKNIAKMELSIINQTEATLKLLQGAEIQAELTDKLKESSLRLEKLTTEYSEKQHQDFERQHNDTLQLHDDLFQVQTSYDRSAKRVEYFTVILIVLTIFITVTDLANYLFDAFLKWYPPSLAIELTSDVTFGVAVIILIIMLDLGDQYGVLRQRPKNQRLTKWG